jgi:hypothetical protein
VAYLHIPSGGIGPVPGGIETGPGAGFNGGKLLDPVSNRNILDTNSPGQTAGTVDFYLKSL